MRKFNGRFEVMAVTRADFPTCGHSCIKVPLLQYVYWYRVVISHKGKICCSWRALCDHKQPARRRSAADDGKFDYGKLDTTLFLACVWLIAVCIITMAFAVANASSPANFRVVGHRNREDYALLVPAWLWFRCPL